MGKIKTSKNLGSDNISSYFLKLATGCPKKNATDLINRSDKEAH